MTEPPHDTGPIAVLLARIEVKLDNSLAEQSRHTTAIDRIDAVQVQHGNRLTALETQGRRDDENQSRSYSRASLWAAALGTAVAVIAVFLTILYAKG